MPFPFPSDAVRPVCPDSRNKRNAVEMKIDPLKPLLLVCIVPPYDTVGARAGHKLWTVLEYAKSKDEREPMCAYLDVRP